MNPIDLKKYINTSLAENILERQPFSLNSTKDKNKLSSVEAEIDSLEEAVSKAVRGYQFTTDPYIEQQPVYKLGESLQDLINKGLIHEVTAQLFALSRGADNTEKGLQKFYNSFRFYEHQQRALKAVQKDHLNLVVCSGTGSGKTECFLLPLIDYLVREKLEQKEYRKGVRALLLYPLNALVNDQLRRIRNILKHCRDIAELCDHPITFGRFTGETPIQEKKTLELSDAKLQDAWNKKLVNEDLARDSRFQDSIFCDNEITKRSEWCNEDAFSDKGPADILITNYAMLERLLIRPDTNAIFERGGFWKFIILDEAHSYDGSKGTEIAWLIRRLNQRVRKQSENMTYLATSATLVDGSPRELRQTLINAGVPREFWSENDSANQLKRTFIQHAFASQIFPATPESFFIEFGELEGMPPESDYHGEKHLQDYTKQAVPQSILDILSSSTVLEDSLGADRESLIRFIPWFWGSCRFWKQLLSQIPNVENKREWTASSFNRMLETLDTASAFIPDVYRNQKDAKLDLLTIHQQGLESRFGFPILRQQSQDFFDWTFEILEEGIASFDKNSDWELLLNDPMDVSSSIRKLKKREPKDSNRFYLLEEWKQIKVGKGDKLNSLSIYSLSYIIKAANECLVGETGACSPEYLTLWVTDEWLDHLSKVRLRLEEIVSILNKVANELHRDVRKFFNFSEQEASTPLEQLFGRVLLAKNSDFRRLRKHVDNCHSRQENETPAESEFSKVAKKLYPNESEGDAQKLLYELNNVASLGQDYNERPLWDIRYHQMIRSTQPASIYFDVKELENCEKDESDADYRFINPKVNVENGIITEITADPSKKQSITFSLGRCMNCMHPYLLGYTEKNNIKEKSLQLYPNRTGRHKHVVAISWIKGETDSEPLYLDPYNGRLYSGNYNGLQDLFESRNLIAIYHHEFDDGRGNICYCPCCRQGTRPDKSSDIITPYYGAFDSNKAVAISAILENLPPSTNPESRSYPGQGKKVLAFSDSRHRSAKLAIDLDKNTSERNMAFLLYHALRDTNRSLREEYGDDIEETRWSNKDCLEGVGASLRNNIVDNQLIGQYLILDYQQADGQDGVRQMSSLDAATAQLIGALRKNYKRSILDLAGGIFDLEEDTKKDLLEHLEERLVKSEDNVILDKSKAEKGIRQAIHWLFSKTNIEQIHNNQLFPIKLISPNNWYRCVSRNRKDGFISFETSSKLQKFIKQSISGGDEKKIKNIIQNWLMDDCWLELTDGGSRKSIIDEQKNVLNPFSPQLRLIPDPDTGGKKLDKILILRAEEHTAQLTSSLGSSYQEAFAKGKINVLSCSTTFEMGVDLGDLSCVFLSNHPPTVANYKQRAGRAGRRAGMGAMVFTYAGKDAHDSYYFGHPDEMFFGTVVPPMIYLDNPVFLARHLRAEAMHRFLCWTADHYDKRAVRRWESVGWFFFGISSDYACKRLGDGERDCWLNYLDKWAESEDHNKFQEYVRGIIGDAQKNNKDAPEYDVIEDLVWQLKGLSSNHTSFDPELCYKLAGPNMGDSTELPLYNRLLKKLIFSYRNENSSESYTLESDLKILNDLLEKWSENELLQGDDDKKTASVRLRHLFSESSVSYLANNRILPRYGFPSDVVELKIDNQDKQGVELTRDMKMGIYEYAQDRKVLANKRVFCSLGARFYNKPRIGDKSGTTNTIIPQAYISQFVQRFIDPENDSSDKTNDPSRNFYMLRPDYFQAARSVDAYSNDFSVYEPRVQMTPGKTEEPYKIPQTNMAVSEYCDRKVVYLNTNNYEGFEWGKTGKRYCLMHTVHTDVLQLRCNGWLSKQGWSVEREKNAWASVAAALKRAVQRILRVQHQDIGITADYDSRSWAIHDASPGGAGFVYRLLLSKPTSEKLTQEEKERRSELIKDIVREALDICKGKNEHCTCYKLGIEASSKIPGDLSEVIASPETYRKHYSCYRCLRDYSNQSEHDHLDVLDATVILEQLLNPWN